MAKKEKGSAIRYSRENIIKAKALQRYQPDVVRAVLTKPEYSISEAVAALNAALRKGVK